MNLTAKTVYPDSPTLNHVLWTQVNDDAWNAMSPTNEKYLIDINLRCVVLMCHNMDASFIRAHTILGQAVQDTILNNEKAEQ